MSTEDDELKTMAENSGGNFTEEEVKNWTVTVDTPYLGDINKSQQTITVTLDDLTPPQELKEITFQNMDVKLKSKGDLMAYDPTMPPITINASPGVTTTTFLDEIVEIENQFIANNILNARSCQRVLNERITSSSTSAKKHNFLRNAEIKSILEHRGICKRWVSKGYRQISHKEFESLARF